MTILREPIAIKELMRLGGVKLGGHNRTALSKFLDDALFALWESAVEEHGPAHAAFLMAKICLRDERFIIPHWLMCRLKAHKDALVHLVDPEPDPDAVRMNNQAAKDGHRHAKWDRAELLRDRD